MTSYCVLRFDATSGWRAQIGPSETPPRVAPGVPILQRIGLVVWWKSGSNQREYPLEAYRVVLQVDEHRVADLKAGQRGELVLSSMPGERYPMTVSKITPVSTAREGRNFFRVEAQLQPDDAARLRPGMEGVAKVTVDDRLLAWIWTRELANWVRLKAWTWTP